MTTITDDKASTTAEHVRKLWVTTEPSPYENPHGSVSVIAETKDDAIAKAGRWLDDMYPPASQYQQTLRTSFLDSMKAVDGDVLFGNWVPKIRTATADVLEESARLEEVAARVIKAAPDALTLSDAGRISGRNWRDLLAEDSGLSRADVDETIGWIG
jgi:hypothetical protein